MCFVLFWSKFMLHRELTLLSRSPIKLVLAGNWRFSKTKKILISWMEQLLFFFCVWFYLIREPFLHKCYSAISPSVWAIMEKWSFFIFTMCTCLLYIIIKLWSKIWFRLNLKRESNKNRWRGWDQWRNWQLQPSSQ